MSDNDHLDGLDDGAGCTETWEYLSQQRAAKASEQATDDEEEDEE